MEDLWAFFWRKCSDSVAVAVSGVLALASRDSGSGTNITTAAPNSNVVKLSQVGHRVS